MKSIQIPNKNRFAIIGAGGLCRQIIDCFDLMPHDVELIDDTKEIQPPQYLYNYLINFSLPEPLPFVLGYSGLLDRKNKLVTKNDKVNEYINKGYTLRSLISKTSKISRNADIQNGVVILDNVIIEGGSSIGEGVLLNTNSTVHHESHIGVYCEICPGALILGGCAIGNYTFIGAGAIIYPDVSIGHHCTIAAGSIVRHNVSDDQIIRGT